MSNVLAIQFCFRRCTSRSNKGLMFFPYSSNATFIDELVSGFLLIRMSATSPTLNRLYTGKTSMIQNRPVLPKTI